MREIINSLSILGVLDPSRAADMSRYFQQTEERLNELDDEASMHALYQLNIGSSVINAQDTIASERAIIVEELLSVLRENHVEPQVNS